MKMSNTHLISTRDGNDHRVLKLVHQLAQSADDIFRRRVSAKGLTPRQYAVLEALSQNEGVTQSKLTNLTSVDRSTMANIVQRLEKKDLIARARTPMDERAYSVTLTDAGRDLLEQMQPEVSAVVFELLLPLSNEEQSSLLASIGKLVSVHSDEDDFA